MTAILAILPVILVILTGFLSVRTGLVPRVHWAGIEEMAYRILFPAILIVSIWRSDLGAGRMGAYVAALFLALAVAAGVVIALRSLVARSKLPDPAFTTLFQTVTRWNAFIAFAIMQQISGDAGVALIAIGMAVLIPPINIVNVIVLASFGPSQIKPAAIVSNIARNPLVIGCAIGIALNLLALPLPGPIGATLDLVGRAALAVGILAVGAGIEPARLWRRSGVMWTGVTMRMAMCPALFFLTGSAFDLPADQMIAGLVTLAVPAAANGYIVARRMGGDAELYADILTWQTILSAITVPALLWVFL